MAFAHITEKELKDLSRGKRPVRLKGIEGSKKRYYDRATGILVRWYVCQSCDKEERFWGAGGLPPRCASCAGGRCGELTGFRYMKARTERQKRMRGGK